jgi:cell wall-associated NlpC family hydrolase
LEHTRVIRHPRLARTLAALALVAAGLTVVGTGPASASPVQAAATGFPAKVDLAGRDRKSTSATEVKTYPAGSTVLISCQAYGEYAYGSPIWDRTTDELWVADHYVKTGSDGFVPGMPRCDNDEPSGGSVDCAAGHGRINGPRGSTAGTTAERIARAIATARTQTGKGLSYSWGAGGKGGAACGISSPSPGGYVDYERFGYDCSGYTLYAFWQGAGVDIGAYTGAQYGAGRRVPYAERQPGDLIFWGSSPTDTTHVAIYLGNDRILEAAPPRGTGSVHETAVYGSTRLGSVVRVLG